MDIELLITSLELAVAPQVLLLEILEACDG
jgi:hypothetical protein